ncbi:MAG: ribonuclease HII [Endomicrobia bacterium]|nr:ribonuclease HII [Endomicrobiia bacterium]
MYNPIFSFDAKIRHKFKANLLAGIDEVGRGCLSGPIVAAAVVFDKNSYIPFLKESKSVSPQKRVFLFKYILSTAIAVSCGIISVGEINKIGINKANYLAMKIALDKLPLKPDLVIIDGFHNPYITDIKQCSFVKADKKSAVVAAASIVAKVIRDIIMKIYHNICPIYDFSTNKGYPTKKHIYTITQVGISELHRFYACKFCVK